MKFTKCIVVSLGLLGLSWNAIEAYKYKVVNDLTKKEVRIKIITGSGLAPKPSAKIKPGKEKKFNIGGIHSGVCLKKVEVNGEKAQIVGKGRCGDKKISIRGLFFAPGYSAWLSKY